MGNHENDERRENGLTKNSTMPKNVQIGRKRANVNISWEK
jgi:hypothetical protein